MRLLIDSHVLLWWLLSDSHLSKTAQDVIADSANEVLVSAVTGYELALKAAAGRLSLPGKIEQFVPSRVATEGFTPLSISLDHASRAGTLPAIHRDPFDRLLVAQAQVEGVPLVTADPAIGQYDVEVIW